MSDKPISPLRHRMIDDMTARRFKYKAALSVAYGAGLRVSEVANLKVSDIDSQRMTLRVEQDKGQRDRYAMLSPQLLELLRDWWRAARPRNRTARIVRARRRGNGSPSARRSFCRFPTITSSSRCPLRSARSHSRTRPRADRHRDECYLPAGDGGTQPRPSDA